ncbi:MAG TPA: response regulator transcription factor [Myxococcota bacterium]|nr:response regulator transcription factor [Myxococcota bacterium]HRY92109.1 response regulator transcription factor [Myxococcota bacterium]HSA20944.1 response regulator transcription factor [Myxococcota bacterium]
MSEPIELVVVEDDPKTMKNLLRLLSAFEEFRVVGNALSGEAGVEAITALQPHLALLDLELPDIDGIEVTARVKAARPQTEVLILTSFEDEVKVYKAIQAGASGYLVKSLAPPRLRQAILDVLAGGTVIEPRLARRFWNYFQSVQGKPQGALQLLEELERDILTMIARGLTNQEAGKVLQLERRTVRTHLGHIYQKLGTTSRAEAVVIALRKGLIQL